MRAYLNAYKVLLHNLLLSLTILLCFNYSTTLHEIKIEYSKPKFFEITHLIQEQNPLLLCNQNLTLAINLYTKTFLKDAEVNLPKNQTLKSKVESRHFSLEREIKPRHHPQMLRSSSSTWRSKELRVSAHRFGSPFFTAPPYTLSSLFPVLFLFFLF